MNLFGKSCLITGANGDLGFELAKSLINRNAKLIITCRSDSIANTTKDNLLLLFPKAQISTLVLPLHKINECKTNLAKFLKTSPKIDFIINNAGIHISKYDSRIKNKNFLTQDDFEINFQVNYLAPVLITETCLNFLSDSAKVIHVFSKDYESVDSLDLSNVRKNNLSASGHKEYARSKLALALYHQKFLNKSPNIASFITSPGVTKTKLWHNVPKLILWFMRNKFHSVESGVIPILKCLELDKAKTGTYLGYSDKDPGWQEFQLNQLAQNTSLQEYLYEKTINWLF